MAQQGPEKRRRALVVACHLRPSRDKRRSSYLMQPISALQVASHIDREQFDVAIHHEDWHGPFDLADAHGYDIVFLSGLQVDFDRMRQLSWAFRRSGRAGRSRAAASARRSRISPPASSMWSCSGSVDSVPDVIADFLKGAVKPRYHAPHHGHPPAPVDYSLLTDAGITPPFHLIEATRGCSFKCSFCVMPVEAGGHASHRLADVVGSIERAIAASPRFSFGRRWPMVLFSRQQPVRRPRFPARPHRLDEGQPAHQGLGRAGHAEHPPRPPLVKRLAESKCVGLFAGIESLDPDMLKRFRKTQNLSRRFNVLDDVAYAESQGIGIAYGLLFDPRHQTAETMRRQLAAIAEDPLMPMPVYISFIAPLAGTEGFWRDLEAGELAPGLRLRDLDGETICYTRFADDPAAVAAFGEQVFRRPWEVIGTRRILMKTWRRIRRSGTWNPINWGVIAAANLHCYLWSKGTPAANRTYRAGTDVLDPQYAEYPADITAEEFERYWAPGRADRRRWQPCGMAHSAGSRRGGSQRACRPEPHHRQHRRAQQHRQRRLRRLQERPKRAREVAETRVRRRADLSHQPHGGAQPDLLADGPEQSLQQPLQRLLQRLAGPRRGVQERADVVHDQHLRLAPRPVVDVARSLLAPAEIARGPRNRPARRRACSARCGS
jgi:hypothetical protein